MIEILKRTNYMEVKEEIKPVSDAEMNKEFEGMMEKIRELVMNDKIDFHELPREIQKEILEAASSGRLGAVMEIKKAWWIPDTIDVEKSFYPKKQLVLEINSSAVINSDAPVLVDVSRVALSSLHSNPSPLLKFHLIELIYFYAYIYCLYGNGLGFEDRPVLVEAISLLINSCETLQIKQSPKSFCNLEDVLSACLSTSIKRADLKISKEFSLSILLQVTQILYSKLSVQLVLSQIHSWLGTFAKQLKKMHFFLVWLNEQAESDLIYLGDAILEYYEHEKNRNEDITLKTEELVMSKN